VGGLYDGNAYFYDEQIYFSEVVSAKSLFEDGAAAYSQYLLS
jgi:hypothetical protein